MCVSWFGSGCVEFLVWVGECGMLSDIFSVCVLLVWVGTVCACFVREFMVFKKVFGC